MSGNHALMSVIIDAGLKCFAALLQPEIVQFAQITIAVFALHKCGDSSRFSDHLMVMAAHRLALDGDFGVANGNDAKQQGAPDTADRGPQRHEGEEHQHPAIAFKTRGFEDFHPGETGSDAQCRASQRPQRQTKQSQQRDLHTFFVSGNSLEVCHGKRDEVQWCAENERLVGVHR